MIHKKQKELKHNTKESHQTTKGKGKKRNKEEIQNLLGSKVLNGNKYISIITLNVNGLKTPIKYIKWQIGWKTRAYNIYVAYKRSFLERRTHIDWKVREWKKYALGNHKKVRIAILISAK